MRPMIILFANESSNRKRTWRGLYFVLPWIDSLVKLEPRRVFHPYQNIHTGQTDGQRTIDDILHGTCTPYCDTGELKTVTHIFKFPNTRRMSCHGVILKNLEFKKKSPLFNNIIKWRQGTWHMHNDTVSLEFVVLTLCHPIPIDLSLLNVRKSIINTISLLLQVMKTLTSFEFKMSTHSKAHYKTI